MQSDASPNVSLSRARRGRAGQPDGVAESRISPNHEMHLLEMHFLSQYTPLIVDVMIFFVMFDYSYFIFLIIN
jgi:hypothetical protein